MVHVIERIGAVSGEEGEEACKKLLTAISTRTAVCKLSRTVVEAYVLERERVCVCVCVCVSLCAHEN